MCFYIKTPKQIAKSDIIVYKVLRRDGRSLFERFFYVINRVYTTKFTYEGLMYNKDYPWPHISRDIINKGFHSYSTLRMASSCFNLVERDYGPNGRMYTCIIPKGAEYYHNDEMQEMVSNKIIIL